MVNVTVGIDKHSKVEIEWSDHKQLCLSISDDGIIPDAYIIISQKAIKKVLFPSLLLILSQCPEIFSDEELREIEFQAGCILEDRMREEEERKKVGCLR